MTQPINPRPAAGTAPKVGIYAGNKVRPGTSGGSIATKTSLNGPVSTPKIGGR